jgi:N-acetyl-anhydromuramyl-L-alanine amidase AmpD
MEAPVNIDDPIISLTPEAFEATLVDRREFHAPTVRSNGRPVPYIPEKRTWERVRGVTLHQTACDMGERVERYDTIGAHFSVLRSGRVLRHADLNTIVFHGNGWNNQCVGVEINGLYAGVEDVPDTAQDEALRSTWDDPSTPTRELPQQVTPQAMLSTRRLIRWIKHEIATHGGNLSVLCAHRQSSANRRNDPGEAIWKQVARPLHAELGLTDGGVGYRLSNGYPIPEEWDPRCVGVKY